MLLFVSITDEESRAGPDSRPLAFSIAQRRNNHHRHLVSHFLNLSTFFQLLKSGDNRIRNKSKISVLNVDINTSSVLLSNVLYTLKDSKGATNLGIKNKLCPEKVTESTAYTKHKPIHAYQKHG